MMLILHTVNEVKKHILTDNNLSIPVPSKVSKKFFIISEICLSNVNYMSPVPSIIMYHITYANCVLYRVHVIIH